MLHHFSFANFNIQVVQKKLQRIREGGGHSNMIQDMVEFSVLGEKNQDPLNKIGFELISSQNARATSHAKR